MLLHRWWWWWSWPQWPPWWWSWWWVGDNRWVGDHLVFLLRPLDSCHWWLTTCCLLLTVTKPASNFYINSDTPTFFQVCDQFKLLYKLRYSNLLTLPSSSDQLLANCNQACFKLLNKLGFSNLLILVTYQLHLTTYHHLITCREHLANPLNPASKNLYINLPTCHQGT